MNKLILILFLLSLFIGQASAATYSVNGTTYPMIYNGTYASQNINYMVSYSNGYDLFWNGGLIQTVWDGTYAYDMIAYPENGTAISPWTFWHVESYNPINKKWGETIPISNQFIKIDNSTLKRVMLMGSGEKFNITYHNYGTQIKQDLELTAALARIYRLTYRIDSVAAQDVNIDTKKFTPGSFNNFTLFDITDVQPFTVNRTLNETSGLWEGDGSYLYGWNTSATIDNTNRKMYFTLTNNQTMAIGQQINIDPMWSTNGSTTPSWQNTTLSNVTTNPNNIVNGISADYFDRENNTDINTNTPYSKWVVKQANSAQVVSSKMKLTNDYSAVNDVNISTSESNYKVSFSHESNGGSIHIGFYMNSLSTNTIVSGTANGYYLDFDGSANRVYLMYRVGIDNIELGNTGAVSMPAGIYNFLFDTNNFDLYNNDTLFYDFALNTSYTSGSLWVDSDSTYLFIDNYRVFSTTSGNLTAWYDFGTSRQAAWYNITAKGNYSVYHRSNTTGNFALLGTYTVSDLNTWNNQSIEPNTKYQFPDLRIQLLGNTISTPELIEVSIEDEAVGGETTSPTYSGASHNQTTAGLSTLFSIQYNDETALHPNGQWIFATNNTGEWVNESAVNWTTTPEWANVTKTLNSTVGTVVGYRWYANDNAGNVNNTPIYSLTVTSPPAPIIISWGNNFSNNESLSFTIEMFQNILFNSTANQTLTLWTWTTANQINGSNQNVSFASYNFTIAGIKTVSVYGNNGNGITQTKTWTINVNNTYPEIIPFSMTQSQYDAIISHSDNAGVMGFIGGIIGGAIVIGVLRRKDRR